MMQFGVNFFPVVDPTKKSASDYFDEALRLVSLAEELGFEHAQCVEHYFSPYGGYMPDPVTFLTAAAARTSRIRIGTGAVIPAFTHPLKLAGKLAMLDNLSHGRLDVGFGRAFLPQEFEAFGIDIDESRARFAEGVEVCRRLWSERDVVWEGSFHRFGPVTMLPRTVQKPHPPIFIASAMSPDSCAAAGRAGHHLQVVPSVTSREQLQSMLAGYREAWREAGHSGTPRIQIKYTCYVAEDRATALDLAETFEVNYVEHMAEAVASWGRTRSDAYQGYEKFVEKVKKYDFRQSHADNKVLAGTPDEVREQIAVLVDWFGADPTLSLQFNPGHMPYEDAERAMKLFAEHVMPAFTGLEQPV